MGLATIAGRPSASLQARAKASFGARVAALHALIDLVPGIGRCRARRRSVSGGGVGRVRVLARRLVSGARAAARLGRGGRWLAFACGSAAGGGGRSRAPGGGAGTWRRRS